MAYDARVIQLRTRSFAAASALALASLSATPTRAGLATETIHTGAPGIVGLAVGSDGTVHTSWESTDHKLHYTRISGPSGKKLDQVVDAAAGTPTQSAIALDSTGQPHITYHAQRTNPTRDVLIHAHFDGMVWQLEELGPGGFSSAVALDAQDRPRIVHAVQNPLTTYSLEYTHLEDSGWVNEQPGGGIGVSRDAPLSLALDGDDHAHVGLVTPVLFEAVYATNASGDWVLTTLPAGDGALGASLALDSLGHPRIAAPVTSQGTVRYWQENGADWAYQDLFDPNQLAPNALVVPGAASLVLDAHDRPQILFELEVSPMASDVEFEVAGQGYYDGTQWVLLAVARHTVRWTRLGIDANGVTYGVYGLGRVFEAKSQRSVALRVELPDLTGQWTGLAVTPASHGKSKVTGTLELANLGPGKSRPAPIALYLSTDATLDGGDTRLPVHLAAGGIAPGGTRQLKVSFAQAGSLAGLYLIAVIDSAHRLDDLDRPNNTIAAPLGD